MDGSGGQTREKNPVAFQFSTTFLYIPRTEVIYRGERKRGGQVRDGPLASRPSSGLGEFPLISGTLRIARCGWIQPSFQQSPNNRLTLFRYVSSRDLGAQLSGGDGR